MISLDKGYTVSFGTVESVLVQSDRELDGSRAALERDPRSALAP